MRRRVCFCDTKLPVKRRPYDFCSTCVQVVFHGVLEWVYTQSMFQFFAHLGIGSFVESSACAGDLTSAGLITWNVLVSLWPDRSKNTINHACKHWLWDVWVLWWVFQVMRKVADIGKNLWHDVAMICRETNKYIKLFKEDYQNWFENTSNDSFSRWQSVQQFGYRKELTITEYSLTTSAKNGLQNPERKNSISWWNRARPQWQRDHQKYWVHIDNVTTKTQNTFNTAHMNIDNFLVVSQFRVVMIDTLHRMSLSTLSFPSPSTSFSCSSFIFCTSSCTSCTSLRAVARLKGYGLFWRFLLPHMFGLILNQENIRSTIFLCRRNW